MKEMESEGGKVTKEIESEGEKVTKGSEPELQKTAAAGENEKVPDRMIPEVKSENAKEEPFSFKNVQPMSTKSEGKDSKSNETATFTFGGHQFQISHQKFQISPQWPKGKSGDESKQDEEDEDEDPSANEDGEHAHDPWFEPIIQLPLIEIQTCEEDEEVLLKDRARLYRFGPDDHDQIPQWKERGTGDVKLLKDRLTGMIRLLMRREHTYSICANHYIYPTMELRQHGGSEKALVWQTLADFADGEPKEEMLAIRFRNKESAENFRNSFDSARDEMARKLKRKSNDNGQNSNNNGQNSNNNDQSLNDGGSNSNNESNDEGKKESNLAEKVGELKL